MVRFILVFLVGAASASLYADGIPIENGHFKGGKVSVLKLSESQIAQLAQGHELTLSEDQRAVLKTEAGEGPSSLTIYDTRIGESDCTDGLYNIGLRYSEDMIEVPHRYLVSDERAAEIAKEWSEM